MTKYEPNGMLSTVAESNLYTMGCTAQVDPRQKIPKPYTMPPVATRQLRARLCVEEVVKELVEALGLEITLPYPNAVSNLNIVVRFEEMVFHEVGAPDMEKAIDACIDGVYVLIGTLCAMGVPDLPHINAVNAANDAKFPGGKAIANEHGKFQKPEGWKPPNHEQIARLLSEAGIVPFLDKLSEALVESRKERDYLEQSKKDNRLSEGQASPL